MFKNNIHKLKNNAQIIVERCAELKPGEKLLIIVDKSTIKVGDYLSAAAQAITSRVTVVKVPQAIMHGTEPPPEVANLMKQSNVIFGTTRFSLFHTDARRDATEQGSRFLSLADYSLEQLASQALDVDYAYWGKVGAKIKAYLDQATNVHITAPAGTDLYFSIDGRVANNHPGYCPKKGTVGSPPDIEVNIPPVENKTEGTLVIDGSFPCQEIGLIQQDQPIILKIKNGNVVKYVSQNQQTEELKKLFQLELSPKRGIIGELGIGLNPKAKELHFMLEAEGHMGVHFGFGNNVNFGGKNYVPGFHLDAVILNPTIDIDTVTVMNTGNVVQSLLE